MNLSGPRPGKEIEGLRRFEDLMALLSLRFINLPADQVDGAIEDAQRLFCESLGLDRSSLYQHFDEEPETLLLTHFYQRDQEPPISRLLEKRAEPRLRSNIYWVRTDTSPTPTYARADVKVLFPWIHQVIQQGEPVVISSLEELPEEADLDREAFRRFGTQSTVLVPLATAGSWLGCLSFASLRERRKWSELEVKRFGLVAHAFTNALVRKRADEALYQSEERFRQVAETVGDFIWEVDAFGLYTYTSPSVERILGYTPSELEGKIHFYDLFLPAVREELKTAASQTFSARQPIRAFPNPNVRKDGRVVHLETSGMPVLDKVGNLIGYRGADMDVTERLKAQEDLRQSEQKFRRLHESMRDAFVSVDIAGHIQEFNPAYQQLLGYSTEELRRLTYMEITPERWHGMEAGILRDQVLRHGYSEVYEKEYRKKDGTVFPVEMRTFMIRDDAGQPAAMWAIVRDITERKLAEDALRKSYLEIKKLKDRLQVESDFLKAEIKVSQTHGEIVGRSPAMKKVLHQVEQVAPADCTVLVSGETGTGKELIAQEIHRLSARKDHLMVLVNCAALPAALVESELFGRERGAYTGALSSQVGRFEVADGSTIFLDEVGELSMEVQAKLLRVLQQGEFQRLGSPRTHKVNVRVISATNRDLAEGVRKGTFREDLYYRLRVFPIEIPPLRERVEDIPLLVFGFMEEFSTRMGKKITKVPRKAMEALQRHSWPGNIRELRNVIEHSVILSSGDTLKLSVVGDAPTKDAQPVTLAEAEREHILRTLESTGWRIKGPHGAAARLDLKPSTLYSRMQKLDIPHRRQKDELPP
jgi:PAS domain S-box-containing protein